MADEPEYGTKITKNSKEASDKVIEHTSKAAEAAKNYDLGKAVKHTLKAVAYAAQAAGHTAEGN